MPNDSNLTAITRDSYLKVAEAAIYLRTHPKTLYKWIREGKIQRRFVMELPNGTMIIKVEGLIRPRKRRPKTYTKVHQNVRNGITH